MANTYTQIHIQAVFVVQNRACLIHPEWENELFKYITGIIQNYDHKVLQINGVADHIHIFFGMRPTQSISDLLKQVKQDSSRWINENGFVKGKFTWQAGFGAFSYAMKDVPMLINYVKNQKKHHATKSFREEYIHFLKEFEVDYNEGYIFKDVE